MSSRVVAALLTGLLTTSCAATTPPPRFSEVSPADAEALEAATPPPSPSLADEAGAEAGEPSSDAATPAAGHSVAEFWACPMHPEPRHGAPGSCPKCGMQLVKRKEARSQP